AVNCEQKTKIANFRSAVGAACTPPVRFCLAANARHGSDLPPFCRAGSYPAVFRAAAASPGGVHAAPTSIRASGGLSGTPRLPEHPCGGGKPPPYDLTAFRTKNINCLFPS